VLRIVICGVGALGSTCVQFLRAVPDTELRLVDFDRVESKNLSAQWFVKASLGKNKAEAIKLQLASFYGLKAEAIGQRLGPHNAKELLAGCGLAVDCFDNADSRLALAEAARAAGVPLVHAALAADGTFGLVRWDDRFVPDREDAEGAATCEGGEHLPMIGVLGSVLARAIQDFAKNSARHDYMVSLSAVTRTC